MPRKKRGRGQRRRKGWRRHKPSTEKANEARRNIPGVKHLKNVLGPIPLPQLGRFKEIFNDDNKRLQAPVKDKVVGDAIWEALVKRKIVDPDVHIRGGVTCLKSLPGCEEQIYHYDYDPEVLRNMVKKPMGVLLAIQSGTTLECFQKVSKNISRLTYHLHIGDLLVFNGDVLHCGSGYEEENQRIHMYIDHKDHRRKSNTTWLETE